jgi:hypothetical protein
LSNRKLDGGRERRGEGKSKDTLGGCQREIEIEERVVVAAAAAPIIIIIISSSSSSSRRKRRVDD